MQSAAIGNIVNCLDVAWLVSPSLRLGQLISILTTNSPAGLFYIPDDELLARLLRWNEWDDACAEAWPA